jgi:hypothetical protein
MLRFEKSPTSRSTMMVPFICSCRNKNSSKAIYPPLGYFQ